MTSSNLLYKPKGLTLLILYFNYSPKDVVVIVVLIMDKSRKTYGEENKGKTRRGLFATYEGLGCAIFSRLRSYDLSHDFGLFSHNSSLKNLSLSLLSCDNTLKH